VVLAEADVALGRTLRFDVTIHEGDAYYAMTRWDFPPSFASCNDHEAQLTGLSVAHIDLCPPTAEPTEHSRRRLAAVGRQLGAAASGGRVADFGIYGGSSCAVYTVEAHLEEATAGPCAPVRSVLGGPCPSGE